MCLAMLLGLAGCAEESARDLVRKEKAAGQYWQSCDLAKHSVRSDRSLLVDIGQCYEHGWGELTKDREAAVNYYEQGARWGIPEAITALQRLGVRVPEEDLLHEEHKHLDEMRSDELKHAVLLAIVGTEMSIDRRPHYDPASGALGEKPRANIANSPAFLRYLEAKKRQGHHPLCALVYVKGHKVDSIGACQ